MKHLILGLYLLALVGCKDNKQQHATTQSETAHEHQLDTTATVYNNAWTAEMQLNNDEKWQANTETNEGVLKIKNLLKTKETNTIEDYHQLAEQLNETKNDIVNKCTMKGSSHDYLHVWLVPLINKIEALSETTTLEDAAKIKHSIEENIEAYSNYFQ